jgi:hypothetical protein
MGGTLKLTDEEELWGKIEYNLSDRGCFNGIDDDVMEELREDLIALIRGSLSVIKRKDDPGRPVPHHGSGPDNI